MIELKNISKKYNNTWILKDVNLELKPGNIYVFKGVSGSGKTTLLNIIAGLDKNYDGDIYVNGNSLDKYYNEYRNSIGYMMQKSLLFRNSTLLENLRLIEDNVPKIEEYAKLFNVYDILNKYPNQISGGEKQRVALIRTLLNDRSIIIADEPTSSLDYENSLIFVEHIKKIDISNKIIIIATHKNIYDDIASEIININFGKLSIINDSEIDNNFKLELNSKKNKMLNSFILSNKNSFGIVFNIIIMLFTITILLVFSIKIKYQSESIKQYLKDNACNVIESKDFLADEIVDLIDKRYDDYEIKEKDYTIYSLLNKDDSVFKNTKYIAYGSFPKKNEVLINNYFVDLKFPNIEYKNIIGEKININNVEYTISGIIDYPESKAIYFGFYENILDNQIPAVFLDYDIIKDVGKISSDSVFLKIKDKYLNDIYLSKKYERNYIDNYQFTKASDKIYRSTNGTKHPTNIALIIIVIISVILMIFLANQLMLELHFQKKKMGYLQVFNFSKNQVRKIYLLQYLINIIKIFALSMIIYLIIVTIIYFKFDLNYFINFYYIFIILIILLFYIFLIIIFPLNKILKNDIIELIR